MLLSYYFTLVVPMREVSCVGYTHRAWEPRSLLSMLNGHLYFGLWTTRIDLRLPSTNKKIHPLCHTGVLMMNVVCRDTGVWQTCVSRLQAVFGSVLCQTIPQEVNRVLFCSKARDTSPQAILDDFKLGIIKINNILKSKNSGKQLLDGDEMLTCTNRL